MKSADVAATAIVSQFCMKAASKRTLTLSIYNPVYKATPPWTVGTARLSKSVSKMTNTRL